MSISEKAKKIKLIGTDIDGVWTDGTMYYSPNGDFMKAFSTFDGMAVQILKEAVLDVLIMTGENSDMVRKRAEKLNIDKIDYLKEAEQIAFENPEIVNTNGSSFSEKKTEVLLGNSKGFKNGYKKINLYVKSNIELFSVLS